MRKRILKGIGYDLTIGVLESIAEQAGCLIMRMRRTMEALKVDDKITLLPVVHGSASYAVAVRRFLLDHSFDCIAIPLPNSFRESVIQGVEQLPNPSASVQLAGLRFDREDAFEQDSFEEDSEEDSQEETEHDTEDRGAEDSVDDSRRRATYVPIDPCQAVIAAIRFGLSDRTPLEFIDQECEDFDPDSSVFPDAYALRETSIERFCVAALPAIPRPSSLQRIDRLHFMARRLNALRAKATKIVCLCDLQDWPWLREAIQEDAVDPLEPFDGAEEESSPSPVDAAESYAVDPRTLLFLMGELPFITGLYENARSSLDDDSTLVVDGIKELLISTRQSYLADMGNRARKIPPLLLTQCLKFIRNQTLLDRRFTPSFYTLARSAQQVMGDQYTIHLVEAAKNYPYEEELPWPTLRMGIEEAFLPDIGMVSMTNRLPGPPMDWKSLELNRPALKLDQRKWKMRWNPYHQCSWPDEDTRIESFRNRVIERAQGMIGADLARTEKFTTSMMDGIDLRETLRHWYDGALFVKVQPPTIGHLDAAVMLFDSNPDPNEYSWRATWFAEHEEESTLAFFATPFQKEMLGPGVAVSTYGGALFLFPPRRIEDIWEDELLDLADTIENRLVAAACLHAQSRHIAFLSWTAPSLAMKKIAKIFKKVLVHVPLNHFSDSVVQQLRTFHVLNGQHVRSYAAHFIRKA